jgi:uncharacterized membrane protein
VFEIRVNGDRRYWRDQESTAIDAGRVLKDQDKLSVITIINNNTRQWMILADPFGPPWIVQPVRRLMDPFRAINEIVFALLFVVAVGLGPFAGVMALFIHNLGVFAKLFSEAIDAVDPHGHSQRESRGCFSLVW